MLLRSSSRLHKLLMKAPAWFGRIEAVRVGNDCEIYFQWRFLP